MARILKTAYTFDAVSYTHLKELEVIDILSNSLARVLKSSDHIASEESTGIFYFGADKMCIRDSYYWGWLITGFRDTAWNTKNLFRYDNSR